MTWNEANITICVGIWIQPLSPFVVGCCKMNNTQVCDEHLFGQVNTPTGCYQLPILRCTNVHQRRYTSPQFKCAILRWRHESQWAHNNTFWILLHSIFQMDGTPKNILSWRLQDDQLWFGRSHWGKGPFVNDVTQFYINLTLTEQWWLNW